MLNTFLAEQAEKEAHLKQQRFGKTKQTHDVAVQCACSRETSDVAVQTDLPDVMEDLKEQVRSLSKIVADLTELKAKEQLPIPLCDLVLSPDDNNNIPPETPPQVPSSINDSPTVHAEQPVNRIIPEPGQNLVPLMSPVNNYPLPQLRSPLTTITNNYQVSNSSTSLGPTDEQKRKVEAIVIMGSQMVQSAMAAVNILFSDEELANSNTGGCSGYLPLDTLKLNFLGTVLRNKYESSTFAEQWEDIKGKINTRCRGKRRTFLRRLQKQIRF